MSPATSRPSSPDASHASDGAPGPTSEPAGPTAASDDRPGAPGTPRPAPDREQAEGAPKGHRWELLACGLRGHQTYDPQDAPELADRLRTRTAQGEAWRCLRCGTYVLGDPRGHGPEADAPTPRRGAELRDAVIMRFLSLERLARALLLAVLAYGIWRFDGAKDSLHRAFQSYLPDVSRLLDRAGINVYDTAPFRLASRVFATGHHTIMLVVLAVSAYAFVEALEGVGLWVMKRWGEYVAVVGTSVFLPYEVYDLVEKVSVLRVLTFLVNLAAVVWLVWSKRLFGVRGGAAAYEKAREGTSILQLERAAH